VAALGLAVIKLLGITGGTSSLAASTIALSPLIGALLLISLAVILVLVAVPVGRLVVYYVNMKKVDLQKEMELQAELLNNNIISLQEKLEKTSDEKERARLQNIINKQIEMLTKLQANIKKYLDEEYEASVAATQQVQTDDNVNDQDAGGGDTDGNNDDFEIEI
jgi:uncharacterized membrane protein YhiD involved in acid resistance